MRNSTFLKSFLLLCALIVGSSSVLAEVTWTRVTSVQTLLDGGTFVMGYEATANSGEIVPLRTDACDATTSANGMLYSGTGTGNTSDDGTITMSTVTETAKYELYITASSTVENAINMQLGSSTGKYIGCPNSKNTAKLYASASANTAYTLTLGNNDTFTLECKAADTGSKYKYLKYNTGSPRFANYATTPEKIVFYKKVSSSDEPEAVVMPTEGVQDWDVTSGQYQLLGGSWTDVPTTEPAKVAFDDDDVYIQLTVSEITLTIKGEKSGNTVTFPKNQAVPYLMTLYLMGTSDGTTASDIVFSYDSGTKTLTQTTMIVASMAKDGVASAMATIKDIILQKAATVSTTIYSWDGSGSKSTANETGGTASAKGGNDNVKVGVSQKGNYCLKLGKGFSNTYYIEIALDNALVGGENLTIGAFRTSDSDAVLGVDFGTTATQKTKDDLDVLSTDGVPSDWEITVPAAAAGSNKIRLYRNSGSTTVWVSKVVVSSESSGSGTDATWSLDPTSATVYAGESMTIQLTTDYDGELTFASNDESIATVSYDSSTKVITVTGVAVGKTTVSVTGDATANYNAINKVIAVTVNHAELKSNFTDVMGPLGYSYFGLTPEGSETYAQPDVTSTDKTDSYGLKVSFAKAGGATQPRFDPDYSRFYKSNTLTVTAPAGSYITKIVFVEPASGAQWKGTMTVVEGDYVNSEKTWYATSTGVTSVVFTGKDDTNRIGSIQVYMMATSVQATVTSAGWATWIAPLTVEVPSTVKAYYVKVNGNKTSLTEKSVIPAGIPVLLQGEGVHQFAVTDVVPNEAIDNDLLISSAGDIPQNPYVLAKPAGKPVGFYKWTDSAALPTGKVYIEYPSTTAPDFIAIGDDATGIEDAVKSEEMRDKSYYNLNGQRVAQPTKGLYIVNGKKVVIK